MWCYFINELIFLLKYHQNCLFSLQYLLNSMKLKDNFCLKIKRELNLYFIGQNHTLGLELKIGVRILWFDKETVNEFR